jgi:hypothetical protein
MGFEKNLRARAVGGEANSCAVMSESVSTHSLQWGVNERSIRMLWPARYYSYSTESSDEPEFMDEPALAETEALFGQTLPAIHVKARERARCG